MEDKRTLLAFLLIGLILLAIPYYYEIVGLGPEPIVEEDKPTPTEERRPADPRKIEEPVAPKTSAPSAPPHSLTSPPPAGQELSSTGAPVFVDREI